MVARKGGDWLDAHAEPMPAGDGQDPGTVLVRPTVAAVAPGESPGTSAGGGAVLAGETAQVFFGDGQVDAGGKSGQRRAAGFRSLTRFRLPAGFGLPGFGLPGLG